MSPVGFWRCTARVWGRIHDGRIGYPPPTLPLRLRPLGQYSGGRVIIIIIMTFIMRTYPKECKVQGAGNWGVGTNRTGRLEIGQARLPSS